MNDRADLVHQAASLYYVHSETMESIAHRLRVSRSTVSRLLKQARDDGVVRITLTDPAGPKSGLSTTFSQIFRVRAHVVPIKAGVAEVQRLDRVARIAGALISDSVQDDCVIGVAWGTTVAAVVQHLSPRTVSGTTVVQLNGAMNPNTSGIPYVGTLCEQVAAAYNSDIVQFPVPAFFDYAETRDLMWRERSVQTVRQKQGTVDLAMFGVGSLDGPMLSHVYSGGYLDDGDMHQLREDGVVGDICTVLLRRDGSWADVSLNARASGVNPRELQRIPRRFAIAAGTAKALPLLAALRARVATDVVVDDLTAQAVLDLL